MGDDGGGVGGRPGRREGLCRGEAAEGGDGLCRGPGGRAEAPGDAGDAPRVAGGG